MMLHRHFESLNKPSEEKKQDNAQETVKPEEDKAVEEKPANSGKKTKK